MRTFKKYLIWVLVISLCFGTMGLSVFAVDTNLDYFFNATVASAENELFVYDGSIVTAPLDPSTLDSSRATHYYAGAGNFSRYSSAHVCRTGNAGEEPVTYDANGTPFYVQAGHNVMESRSLYVDDYYMDGAHIMEKCYARWDYIQTFVLADTRTGKISTAYCADQTTPAQVHNYYNMQNLEDAVYYSPAQADYIRAVALNGYWGQPDGIGSLSYMRNMLAASGQFTPEELALLTDGVAMTATQYAIWHYTNSNTGDKRISAYNTTESGDITRVSEEQKASVNLIFKVFYYLTSLSPASVENTTANSVINKDNFLTALNISNAVLIEGHANNLDADEDNDAYLADVTFTMGVLPLDGNGDDLVAQIVDAENNVLVSGRIAGPLQEGEVLLQGSNGTYCFKGLELIEGNQKLKVQLDGNQVLRQGVYLYTHESGYTASQTLVGIAEGTHTVDVEKDWELSFFEEPERELAIRKETPAGQPLSGVQFDFYPVADRDAYLAGTAGLPENAADYTALPAAPSFTLTTGEDGGAAYNLTQNNQPDGVYLVKEREHPAILQPVEPFYVVIPARNGEDPRPIYRVELELENEIRSDTDIVKDVIELDNNLSNQNAYATHTWIISTSIPADIGIGRSFVISDQLDNRLDLMGNITVTVENGDGSVTAAILAEGTDYTLNVTDNDSLAEGKPSDSFVIRLTAAGMEKTAAAASADITRVRVRFDARINANARMGELIPNQAELNYVNSLGVAFNPRSDIPGVYTGGLRLKKIDINYPTIVLQGAEFKLYRKASAEEAADTAIEKVTKPGIAEPLVSVRFFANPDLSGEKTDVAVSGADGIAYMYGLVDGEYYLVETKAPGLYKLNSNPIKVTINQNSHLDENVVVVGNDGSTVVPPPPTPTPPPYVPPTPTPPPTLPQTGQVNWPVPVLAAAGLLFLALGWVVSYKGKRKSDGT